MKYLVKIVLALVIGIAPWGATQASDTPILNVENQPVARVDGKPVTAEQVKQAIVRAGALRGWVFTPDRDGHMIGRIDVRGKHTATIDIIYSANSFNIRYIDSTNLDFRKDEDGKNVIHNNYNRWVNNLRHDTVNAVRGLID